MLVLLISSELGGIRSISEPCVKERRELPRVAGTFGFIKCYTNSLMVAAKRESCNSGYRYNNRVEEADAT